MKRLKVVIIGAGSVGFSRHFVRDILSIPEFRDTTDFALTDINARNLDMTYRLLKREMEYNRVGSTVTATLNRRAALKNANYVFASVRVGGLEAYQMDIDIPLQYGVDQCVGDTICAGGIMYAQRSIPPMLDFCRDIREVAAKDCVFMSHVNPMAMNTWACSHYGEGVKTIGLCHGVQCGQYLMADAFGLKPADLDILCAGINHQTWFLQVRHNGKDMTGKLLAALEKHPIFSKTEKVRIDMLRRFGAFSTESNGHLSEYVPWYRKRPKDIPKWIDTSSWIHGETGGYLRICTQGRRWFQTDFPNWMKEEPVKYGPEHRGIEHGSGIIEGLETGRVYRGHFNVVNNGAITNLPSDAIVEVPGYADRNGISIPIVGDLPLGCAAVCNASISVQRLATEAAVHGDDRLLRQAMMMDPLVGAVCDPPEIWQMVDDMLIAQAPWLPQYRRAIAAALERRKHGKRLPIRKGYKGAVRIPVKTIAEMRKNAVKERALAAAADKGTADSQK
jgi:alpha-galactosidase